MRSVTAQLAEIPDKQDSLERLDITITDESSRSLREIQRENQGKDCFIILQCENISSIDNFGLYMLKQTRANFLNVPLVVKTANFGGSLESLLILHLSCHFFNSCFKVMT